jgi:hypothetical protein
MSDANRKSLLDRGFNSGQSKGYSKELQKIIDSSSGKHFVVLIVFLLIVIIIVCLVFVSKDEQALSKENVFIEIASIVSYAVLGITVGRASYRYVNKDASDTAGEFAWYFIFWPFYTIIAGGKYVAGSSIGDKFNQFKSIFGWEQLSKNPSNTDKISNFFKVFSRISILISIILMVYYLLGASSGLAGNSIMKKDTTVLTVIAIIVGFMVFTPDIILDSKGWQYRASIFFVGFFFLFSLHAYMLGSFEDADSGRKDKMLIATVSSGVLLFFLIVYYYIYKLPEDDASKMLRGIFTEEQRNSVNPNLASQVKLLEQVSNNSDLFDGEYFNKDKLSEEVSKTLSESLINKLNGRSKDSIVGVMESIDRQFVDIYRAKLAWGMAVKKYDKSRDGGVLSEYFNSEEFTRLQNTDVKNEAMEFRKNTLEKASKRELPDILVYQKLFGTEEGISLATINISDSSLSAPSASEVSVPKELNYMFNRAIVKELASLYQRFVVKQNDIGFSALTDIPPLGRGGIESGAFVNYVGVVMNNIKTEEHKNTFSADVVKYKTNCAFNPSELDEAKITLAKASIADGSDCGLEAEKYFKDILGKDYVPLPMERGKLTAFLDKNKDKKKETEAITKYVENRYRNLNRAENKIGEYKNSILILMKRFANGISDGSDVNVMESREVQEKLKILNKGLGDIPEFKEKDSVGRSILEQAKLEAESKRGIVRESERTSFVDLTRRGLISDSSDKEFAKEAKMEIKRDEAVAKVSATLHEVFTTNNHGGDIAKNKQKTGINKARLANLTPTKTQEIIRLIENSPDFKNSNDPANIADIMMKKQIREIDNDPGYDVHGRLPKKASPIKKKASPIKKKASPIKKKASPIKKKASPNKKKAPKKASPIKKKATK